MVSLLYNVVVGGRLYCAGSVVDDTEKAFQFVREIPGLVAESDNDNHAATIEDPPSLPAKILVHRPPEGVGHRRHLVRKTK